MKTNGFIWKGVSLVKTFLDKLFPSRVCYRDGTHKQTHVEARDVLIEPKIFSFSSILEEWSVPCMICDHCGKIIEARIGDGKFLQSFNSVSMPSDKWRVLREQGYIESV